MLERKKWQNPELIVLVRGKPEEMVLSACKGGFMNGPVGDVDRCVGGATACLECSSAAPS